MTGKLIINVDDFGFTSGINAAVRELARLGTISATNIMLTMPYVGEAVQLAADFPRLSIGVHLNLTQGKPLLPPEQVPTLVDAAGNFHPLNELRRRSVSASDVQQEIRAQVDAAFHLLGKRIDHWNSHQGIHRFRPFRGVIRDVCRAFGIPATRSHRHFFAFEDDGRLKLVHPTLSRWRRFGLRRVLVETFYDWNGRGNFFRTPDGLIAVEGGTTLAALQWALRYPLPPGTWEIPCHTATTTAELFQTTMLESRVQEYEFLASETAQAALHQQPDKLVGFIT